MIKRAAIILAGGKAKRFQSTSKWQDKALAEINGKPLLVHVIENVWDIVEEVIVVTDENQSRTSHYFSILEEYNFKNVRVVTDIKIKNLSGPLIAILTGLKSASANHCITIPSDMPMLKPKVAEYLFNQIVGSHVVVPMWPSGRLETLLMVLEREYTLEIANVLCQLGRSHPDDIIRGALKTLFVSPLGRIRVFDQELRSFININCPEDLSLLQPRQGQGSTAENLRLNLGRLPIEKMQCLNEASLKRNSADFLEAKKIFSSCAVEFEGEKSFFWAALSWEQEAKSLSDSNKRDRGREVGEGIKESFVRASQNYVLEAKIYKENRCYLLAERANADATWCDSQVEKTAAK